MVGGWWVGWSLLLSPSLSTYLISASVEVVVKVLLLLLLGGLDSFGSFR